MPSSEAKSHGTAVLLHQVSKLAPDGRTILDPISFEVVPGEHVAIVGPSGSGKSMILYMIAIMEVPTKGVVLIDNLQTTQYDYRATLAHRVRSGYVFTDRALLANMSIFENIALPIRYHEPGLPEERVDARVHELLEEFKIADAVELLPFMAAPSVRKRALFARALALEPALLLADEPQARLTEKEQELVRAACERRRAERGMTLIQTDHDGVFGPLTPDRVVEVVDSGTPRDNSLGDGTVLHIRR
jgi:ABC-type lipoprotein export system ATPase subunit